jgi:hypothetical protein
MPVQPNPKPRVWTLSTPSFLTTLMHRPGKNPQPFGPANPAAAHLHSPGVIKLRRDGRDITRSLNPAPTHGARRRLVLTENHDVSPPSTDHGRKNGNVHDRAPAHGEGRWPQGPARHGFPGHRHRPTGPFSRSISHEHWAAPMQRCAITPRCTVTPLGTPHVDPNAAPRSEIKPTPRRLVPLPGNCDRSWQGLGHTDERMVIGLI